MQVQVVENQAVIVGKVRETAEDPSRKGFFTLKVDVERVDDVAGMPNLMAWAKKMTIDVTIAEKDLSVRPLEPGQKYSFRVKKASPTAVVVVPGSTPAPVR